VAVLCCAARAIAEETTPDARLLEAQSAYEQAKKLHEEGKYAEAVMQAEHALALREAVLGKNHLDVADSLACLATLYWEQGLYERAEPLHHRALTLREAARGKDHPDVADSLNDLALLY
jgi:hypothetical protein